MDNKPYGSKQRFKFGRFFEGEPVNGTLKLSLRRIVILPTRRGLGMAFTILLLLLVAFIYNNNLVYLLAFLLTGIFVVTILHTYNTLAGLLLQAGPAGNLFAGELAGFTLTVTNPVALPRFSLTAFLESELKFDLAAHESKRLILHAASRKRGWQRMGKVTLATCYPFGLFRASSQLRFDCQVLVYPKPISVVLPLPTVGDNEAAGQRAVETVGVDDFGGIRTYQMGDSPRHIHWKAYAKGQGLFSKQYMAEAGGNELWLVFEQTPGHDTEQRLSQLCRWVLDAENAGLRYGLRLPGRKIEPSRGPQHQADCLRALALF